MLPVHDGERELPSHTEVVHIPSGLRGAPYPGVFVFTQAARMVRPVRQSASGAAELIGTLEQNNLSIRMPDGGQGGTKGLRFTHAGGWVGPAGLPQRAVAGGRYGQGHGPAYGALHIPL